MESFSQQEISTEMDSRSGPNPEGGQKDPKDPTPRKRSGSTSRYVTMNQAGKILGVTHGTVFHWIRQEKLPATKLANGRWQIKRKDIEDILKANQDSYKRQILLIDDKCERSESWATALNTPNNNPHLVFSVKGAVRRSSRWFPRLIVLNVSMESTDGWEVLKKIREKKSLRRVPIVLTADRALSEDEYEHAATMGVRRFVQYPDSPEGFVESIEEVFKDVY